MKTTVLISIVMLASSLFASGNKIRISLDNGNIEIDRKSGKIISSQLLGKQNAQQGGIKYFDGKKKKELGLPVKSIVSSGHEYVIQRTVSPDGLVATEKISQRNGCLFWQVECKNNGTDNKWLAITLDVPSGMNCKNLLYWDGFAEKQLSRFHCSRQGVFLAFPATLLRTQPGKTGLLLGINPNRDYSYISSLVKSENMAPNSPATMSYSVRLVVDPGKTETAEFIMGVVRSDYGLLNAVQKYYDLFPSAFYPHKGIDPRLLGAGRYIYGKNGLRNLQMEFARRMNLSWEWSYGVFQTPGDWFPDQKYWKNEKGYPGPTDSHRNPAKGTLENYMRDTTERFLEGRKSIAMMFYLLPQNCDKTLLEKYYPDSYFYTEKGARSTDVRSPIKEKDDCNIDCWFSPATTYGRDMRSDMLKVAKFFHPRGFAFDCAHGCEPYGGPLVGKSRARAWGNNGEYVLTGIEMVDLYNWVHSIKVDGYALGVATNLTYAYMVFREADVLMFEPAAFREKDYKARRMPMRLLAGHKLLNIHKGVMREAHDILRWEELSPEDIRTGLKGMVDYQLLWCFRYGAFPTDDIIGIRKVHEYAPVLLEMNRYGWQALPAATSSNELWISRYGNDINTRICIANPKRFKQNAKISVDMDYLSNANYIFAMYDGSRVLNKLSGSTNTLKVSVDSHEVSAIQAIIKIDGKRLSGTGDVKYDKNSTATDTMTAEITLNAPTSKRNVTFRLPDGATPKALTLNSSHVEYTYDKELSTVSFSSQLTEKNRIEITYTPQVVIGISSKTLCELPYMKSNLEPNLTIACDKNSQLQAERIAAYFEYWYLLNKYPNSGGVISNFPSAAPKIRICELDKIPNDAGMVLAITEKDSNKSATISLDESGKNKTLNFAAPDQLSLSAAVSKFLAILDTKYPYYGFLGSTPLLEKADLVGKILE